MPTATSSRTPTAPNPLTLKVQISKRANTSEWMTDTSSYLVAYRFSGKNKYSTKKHLKVYCDNYITRESFKSLFMVL